MSVKIGINPITWTNDDVPELGGDTPLETCLSETRQAGFLGTELGGKFPRESKALGAVLGQHELELVSGWWDGRILERTVDEEFDAILPHLILLRNLGAGVVVYADTSGGRHDGIWQPISRRPRLPTDGWTDYGNKVTALAEKMAEFGVAMAFHHHMGTIVETEEEIDLLMANTGEAVGLLYDSGHIAFAGGNPVTLVRRHGKRINHVHCKDTRPETLTRARANDASFMDAVTAGIFTVPGDGNMPYETILKDLKEVGYAGWLVVEAEQDTVKAHPLTYARMGRDNLLRLAKSAGFHVVTHAGATA